MLFRDRLLHLRSSDFGAGVTRLNDCRRKRASGRMERVCGDAGAAHSLVQGWNIVQATCSRPPAGRSGDQNQRANVRISPGSPLVQLPSARLPLSTNEIEESKYNLVATRRSYSVDCLALELHSDTNHMQTFPLSFGSPTLQFCKFDISSAARPAPQPHQPWPPRWACSCRLIWRMRLVGGRSPLRSALRDKNSAGVRCLSA